MGKMYLNFLIITRELLMSGTWLFSLFLLKKVENIPIKKTHQHLTEYPYTEIHSFVLYKTVQTLLLGGVGLCYPLWDGWRALLTP